MKSRIKFDKTILMLFCMMSAFICGCGKTDNGITGKGIYYWRTILKLSDVERSFLLDNNVDIVYLHLFDVRNVNGKLLPASTLLFHDTIPDGIKIVPVVFIEPDAFKGVESVDSLASLIISRADDMLVQNGYQLPDEIQIDFDWTRSNRERYFEILGQAREIMHSRGRKLSTTIRLHQLADAVPPVDYGVLMVYNVGNITDFNEKNSILSRNTVAPYLEALGSYKLPLATALPVYSWNIVFSGGEFKAIAHSLNPYDTAMFVPVDSGLFRCIKYGPLAMAGSRDGSGGRIYPGDIVRNEFVPSSVLSGVLSDLRATDPDVVKRIIFYHLDEKSIRQYGSEFLQNLFEESVNN